METIDFLQLKKDKKISESEYKALSWLGFCKWQYDLAKEEKYYWLAQAYSNTCLDIMKIDPQLIWNISDGNYKGLQNFNRIASFETIA